MATEDEPTSIALYPTDLDGKEAIQDFIAAYNDQAPSNAEKVTCTDLVSTMISAITLLVNIVITVPVGFSVPLTVLAGWVPSRVAARKDPVVALRGEWGLPRATLQNPTRSALRVVHSARGPR